MMGQISIMIQSWFYLRVRCGMVVVSKDTIQTVFFWNFVFYFIFMVYNIEITKSVFMKTLDLSV